MDDRWERILKGDVGKLSVEASWH